eukprot:TRINITY_DN10505_c0_g2_i6.p1 TRINITY_DN10505_c0_g2~~TRINITY_DN10505_c0_g2_i6.p1  ORF type:complete len:126 (-),score=29.01 TRINITY_DN10505_c0_g2_i6:6-383(-)
MLDEWGALLSRPYPHWLVECWDSLLKRGEELLSEMLSDSASDTSKRSITTQIENHHMLYVLFSSCMTRHVLPAPRVMTWLQQCQPTVCLHIFVKCALLALLELPRAPELPVSPPSSTSTSTEETH